MPESRTGGSSTARADQGGAVLSPVSASPPSLTSKGELDPLIGRMINGRFRIVSVIARGGMGKVYKAEQAPLGRICALKVLSPKYDGDRDPEFHKRFFLEASTAAKLSHPNTVTIFDYGQSDDDIYYIAMEYIEGRTLHRVLRDEGPLPESRVAHIAAQICRSLREAHGLGVVHRDLKPGNILVSDRGDERDNVKVLDFGLVKDVSGEAEDLTQAGLFMGSPKYMAPEQILGGEITPCTDIYSLGVMMYEMLSGKVPFDRGASVGTLMAHVNEVPPAIRSVNPNVSPSPTIESIVSRCLEKEPSKRFSSMKDLLVALKRVVAGDGSSMTDTHESLPMARSDLSSAFRRGDSYSGPIVPAFSTQPPPSGSASPSITDSVTGPGPAPPADTEDMARARPKGRAYVWVLAAAVAVGITVAVVLSSNKRPTADTSNTATPANAGTTTTTAPAETTAPPAVTPTNAPAAVATVRVIRIESEPSGASVSENGTELCMSTPCEVTLKGDAAAAEHKISLSKKGYKTAKVTIATADEKVTSKLDIIPITGGGRPPPTPATGATGKAKPNPYGD